MTRSEIEAELHDAVQSYKNCSASAETARQMLTLGMGSISDVTAKTYLEANAYARWLKAAERFVAAK